MLIQLSLLVHHPVDRLQIILPLQLHNNLILRRNEFLIEKWQVFGLAILPINMDR